MRQTEEGIEIEEEEPRPGLWARWLDLETDYAAMRKRLARDPVLAPALDECRGLRILRQDPYETILAFLLSANNNMPRITRSLNLIAENYGKSLGSFFGEELFALPDADALAAVDPAELREKCGTGYRDAAISAFARAVSSGEFRPEEAARLDDAALFSRLTDLKGVGPKVAQCILLFGFHRMGAFPVDVWIDRILRERYGLKGSRAKLEEFGLERFGEDAGYAQQLLFVLARHDAKKQK